ncbi:cytochrome P450 2C18-like isoform X2 [Mytilus californianus]|uniref:cytochrome P450 2C18-like isoform X2 n=1 Tax=Mytilus californianus TaxID=6549 RepID=UPI002245AC90|nr:cytochrome P450 2C18-like isoform X2 [Mytilus californianus]
MLECLQTLDLSLILIFALVFLVTLFCVLRKNSKLPGPTPWPLFGNLFTKDGFLINIPIDNLALFKKYGPVFTRFLGPHQIVYVSGYKTIVQLLKKQGNDFVDRPNWIPVLQKNNRSKGLVWSNGDNWKTLRRLTLHALRDFGVGKTSVEEKILEEVKCLIKEFEKTNGEPVRNIKRMMLQVSCNVIHNIVFGHRYSHDDLKLNKLIDAFEDVFTGPPLVSPQGVFPILLIVTNLLKKSSKMTKRIKAGGYIQEYVTSQIDAHKTNFDENFIRDFVDVYIQNEREQCQQIDYGKKQLLSLIVDLFGAGTDTTATTLHWALLYMIQYPDVQLKCQIEISKVIGNNRTIKSNDKRSLPYVQATLLEIQRLANTAPGTLPRMAVQDTTINGYRVPKGAIVMINLESVHHDDTVWVNAKEFNPDRFLNDDKELINKEYLMPFSIGTVP